MGAVLAYVLGTPIALIIRAYVEPLGQVTLLILELQLLGVLCILTVYRPSITRVGVLTIVFVSVLYGMVTQVYPNWEVWYLGFRKSIMVLVALGVATGVEVRDQRRVHLVVAGTLLALCLYGLKQLAGLSEFDMRIMALQAAGEYTGVFGGQVRATSVLASGFHLGMAGALLFAIALSSGAKPLYRLLVAAIGLGAIYASITRTFMMVAGLLAIVALMPKTRKFRLVVVAVLGASVCLSELLGYSPFELVAASLSGDSRFMNRGISYISFIQHLANAPTAWLHGFGVGSAGSALGASFDLSASPWIEPHSIYLKYVFELGLPIGGLAIALLLVPATRCLKPEGGSHNLALLASLVLLISGLTITSTEALPVSAYVMIVAAMCRTSVGQVRG